MKSRKFFHSILIFALIVFFTTNAFSLNRHTYHTSLTRIDYNSKEKLFEISIQLFLHDLLPLLEKRAGKPVVLEQTAEADRLIQKYLSEQFILKDKKGAIKSLKWVGKEMDVDSIYIYLETTSEESLEHYSLQNTVFFESFRQQTNLVICRFENKKADLVFKVGDREKKIIAGKPNAE
jgi:hypothetical protein